MYYRKHVVFCVFGFYRDQFSGTARKASWRTLVRAWDRKHVSDEGWKENLAWFAINTRQLIMQTVLSPRLSRINYSFISFATLHNRREFVGLPMKKVICLLKQQEETYKSWEIAKSTDYNLFTDFRTKVGFVVSRLVLGSGTSSHSSDSWTLSWVSARFVCLIVDDFDFLIFRAPRRFDGNVVGSEMMGNEFHLIFLKVIFLSVNLSYNLQECWQFSSAPLALVCLWFLCNGHQSPQATSRTSRDTSFRAMCLAVLSTFLESLSRERRNTKKIV